MIQCKRVYDPQESSDGYRVLVDRLWPRGIKKEALACDEWCKELTPSADAAVRCEEHRAESCPGVGRLVGGPAGYDLAG